MQWARPPLSRECGLHGLSNADRRLTTKVKVGEPKDRVALACELAVAAPVALKRTSVVMKLAPVDLDHHPVGSHQVHPAHSFDVALRVDPNSSQCEVESRERLRRRLGPPIHERLNPRAPRRGTTSELGNLVRPHESPVERGVDGHEMRTLVEAPSGGIEGLGHRGDPERAHRRRRGLMEVHSDARAALPRGVARSCHLDADRRR